MKVPFVKMHGCGNDYIYFDGFREKFASPDKLAVHLSDRHFGIGGDGVIFICPSDKADAKMRMFNADGSEGKMCGNGIRCVGKYLYDHNMTDGRTEITVETLSGIKKLHLTVKEDTVRNVRVDMGSAVLTPRDIPVLVEGRRAVDVPITVEGKLYRVTCVSMGNPHCVIFTEQDVDTLQLTEIGPGFENHPLFPERVNTEFVNVLPDGSLKMRVWERGSGETMACGTGACAVGTAAVLRGIGTEGQPICIHLRGGDLEVCYTEQTVWLTGPAETVFEGMIEL